MVKFVKRRKKATWILTAVTVAGMMMFCTETEAKSKTLEQNVAQLFFVTPDQLSGVEGTTIVGDLTKEAYARCPVGGIIFMESNLESKEQLMQMIGQYQELSMQTTGLPLFTGIDEEGGRVARIAHAGIMETPQIPSMYEIGQTGETRRAYQAGKEIGSYLREVGLNVDFAPVADVWVEKENQVISDRSFGEDPNLVADMVAEAVRGFQNEQIRTVIKHFPGHGNTTEDSHSGYAYNPATEQEFSQGEWIPFQSGIEEGTEFVMTGHICCPNITEEEIPASLSKELTTNILRKRLGFQGIIITDALNMGAITDRYSSGEAAVRAIEAGADMLLMPEDLAEAYEAVLQAVRSGRISEERIWESVSRIEKEKES